MIVIAKLFKNKELEVIDFVTFFVFYIPKISVITISKGSKKLNF